MFSTARKSISIHLVAWAYAVYQFIPVFPWLLKNDVHSGQIPYFPHQDTTYYLALIKDSLLDKTGNSFFVDAEGATLYSRIFPEIIGLAFKYWTTNLQVVWIVTVTISAYFSYLLVYRILFNLFNLEENPQRSPLYKAIVALFLFVIVGTQFQRVSPTETGFTLFLLIVHLIVKNYGISQWQKWLVPILILGIINPYYGGLAVLTTIFLLISMLKTSRVTTTFFYLILGGALAIGANWLEIPDNDLFKRLDITYSHLPGAIIPSAKVLSLFIILSLSWPLAKKELFEYKFLKYLSFAILFMLNQQVLTGLTWEPESHLRLIIDLTLFLVLLSAVRTKRFTEKRATLLTAVLSIGITFFSLSELNSLYKETQSKIVLKSNQSQIINDLKNEIYSGKSILFKRSTFNQNQIATIGLITEVKFYWHPNSVFLPVSTYELSKRYACTLEDIDSFDYATESYLFLGHTHLNEIAFHRKYSKLMKSEMRIVNEIVEAQAKQRVRLVNAVMSEFRECSSNSYTYVVDYVVYTNPDGQIKISEVKMALGEQ